MDNLEQYYQFLKEKPFPDYPADDQLSEIFEQLVYLDSVYVGYAQRALGGEKILIPNINEITKLNDQVKILEININDDEKGNFINIKQRIEVVYWLARELIRRYERSN